MTMLGLSTPMATTRDRAEASGRIRFSDRPSRLTS
jgi:hypothetical protein